MITFWCAGLPGLAPKMRFSILKHIMNSNGYTIEPPRPYHTNRTARNAVSRFFRGFGRTFFAVLRAGRHCRIRPGLLHTDGMETNGHRRLRRFLMTSELTCVQLAQLAGVDPNQLYHLTSGRRRASLELAVRLEEATRGAVDVSSWIEAAPLPCESGTG